MKKQLIAAFAVLSATLLLSGVSMAQRCSEPGVIKSVTKARSAGFETITFEVLSKDPKFEVKNAKPPFSMYASEKPLRIKGSAFKSIVFREVNWTCKIRENLSAATATITAVKNIEQFEGQVEYIIGYSARSKYVGQSSAATKTGRKITLKFKR